MARTIAKGKNTATPSGSGITRNTRAKKVIEALVDTEHAARYVTRTGDERHALLVVPADASPQSRVVSLVNPATSKSARYFFCPKVGLHEFTKIGPSTTVPRSCLITPESQHSTILESNSISSTNATTLAVGDERGPGHDNYVLENGDVFIATPFDPVFLLTPVFSTSEGYYRPAEDYIDQVIELSANVSPLIQCSAFKDVLLDRLALISATQDIGGGEVVYRPQMSLLLELLRAKCINIVKRGLPASMEEALVQKILEVPLVPRQNRPIEQSAAPSMCNEVEQQASAGSSEFRLESDASESHSVPLNVVQLMRQRVALDFIFASYIPVALRTTLETLLQATFKADFAPLEDHLAKVKQAKAEAQALRSLSDNISRKRSAFDDDEAVEIRAEKKRKKDEEEKRKKAETRATKVLQKVDTSGMKKLSSFFTRSASAAQA